MERLRRIALIPFGVLVALVVLLAVEGVLRAFDVAPDRPGAVRFAGMRRHDEPVAVWDRDLLYRLVPNAAFLDYYRTNARGYRGAREFEPEDGSPRFRIACVGDSCTFGLGVGEEQAWPARIERTLARLLRPGTPVEVLNLGVPGYSSFQNLRQIETEVLDLKPDVVLWMPTGFNDGKDGRGLTDAERAERHGRLIARLTQLRLARVLGAEPADPGASNPRVPVADIGPYVRRGAEVCRERGVPLVVVLPAFDPAQLAREPDLQRRIEEVDRAAAAAGAVRVDVRPAFDALAPWPLHLDGTHPTPEGHSIIARGVIEALADAGALPDAEGRGRFIAWWLDAWRRGLAAAGPPPPAGSWPGEVAASLALLRRRETNERLEHDDPTLPAELRAWDPLYGTRRDKRAAGAAWVVALRRADPEKELRARGLDSRIVPADPLRRLLFGEDRPDLAALVRLPEARALAVLSATLELVGPRVDRSVLAGMDALRRGDVDQALAACQDALSLAPADPDARALRIDVLSRLGRHREALNEARHLAAMDLHPRHAIQLGVMLLERGLAGEARPWLERGLAGDPVHVRGLYALGRILLEEGDVEQAAKLLRSAWAINQAQCPDVPGILAKIESQAAEAPSSR